jgi:acyl-CoA hydrolase
VSQRAEALAAIAHPDMRESLAKQETGVPSIPIGH